MVNLIGQEHKNSRAALVGKGNLAFLAYLIAKAEGDDLAILITILEGDHIERAIQELIDGLSTEGIAETLTDLHESFYHTIKIKKDERMVLFNGRVLMFFSK